MSAHGYLTSVELEDEALDFFVNMPENNPHVPVVDLTGDLDEPLTDAEINAINAGEQGYIVLTADQLDQILARMRAGDDLAEILGGLPLISAA